LATCAAALEEQRDQVAARLEAVVEVEQAWARLASLFDVPARAGGRGVKDERPPPS
jgi:hypothetical protein